LRINSEAQQTRRPIAWTLIEKKGRTTGLNEEIMRQLSYDRLSRCPDLKPRPPE
jgi:hypothetical protein